MNSPKNDNPLRDLYLYSMVHPDVAAAYVRGMQVPGTILREEVPDVSLTPYILNFEPEWEEVTRDLISTVCLKDQSGTNTGYAEKTYRVVYIDINPNSPTYGYLWITPVKEEVKDTASCPIDNFMYIENNGSGIAQVSMKYTGSSVSLEYCVRNASSNASSGEWQWASLDFNSLTEINPDKRLYLRGNNPEGLGGIVVSISKKPGSEDPYIALGGSVQSLCDGTGMSTTAFNMEGLFVRCTYIREISKGFLPATVLVPNCYRSMFAECSNLENTPDLPATVLAENCYVNMFSGCTSLVSAPALPATTLGISCYMNMFTGCTSLVSAPALPATDLAQECYRGMFASCTSLVSAPDLPTTALEQGCYWSMFSGCTSLVSAPALPATSLAQNCYANMFASCTSLVNAPNLPATTSSIYCYKSMFANCTSLVSAPNLPAINAASYCYQEMFKNCTSLVNAPVISAEYVGTCSCMMMFSGCTSLINAPALPATYLGPSCYFTMFSGCTSLNHAPDLPAGPSGLKSSCYGNMFSRCSFDMSDNGTSFNFNCGVTFPYSGAAGTFNTPYDMAVWMGNTHGLNEPTNYMYIENNRNEDASINFLAGDGVEIELGVEKGGIIQWEAFDKRSLHPQERIYLRGNNNKGLNSSYFMISGVAVKLGGSVQSLCDGNGMSTTAYEMGGLFAGIVDVDITIESGFLSATTLTENCYRGMFAGCDGLKNAPNLPASALVSQCYMDMFKGCSFKMSYDGSHFNFDCGIEFPYDDGELSFTEPYDMAGWMGNTKGFQEPSSPKFMYMENVGDDGNASIDFTVPKESEIIIAYGIENKEGDMVWTDWSKEDFMTISVDSGDKVYFKGNNKSLSGCHFAIDKNYIKLGGSVQSLCDDNGASTTAYEMNGLFSNNIYIQHIDSGFLPATTLSTNCYKDMFSGCGGLRNAPDLPATVLSDGCYESMFAGCTQLESVSDLPADVLESDCYKDMYKGCTFDMSKDGSHFVFDCGIEFPYKTQEFSFGAPSDMAGWMGNTNGFK